jgi:DNA-binding NarL/FixJ family response regulator
LQPEPIGGGSVDQGSYYKPLSRLPILDAWEPSGGPRNYVANMTYSLGPGSISERAREIVGLSSEGLSDKEIATKLNITSDTVDYHWRALRARYGATSRVQVVSRVIRDGLTDEVEALLAERETLLYQLRMSRKRRS